MFKAPPPGDCPVFSPCWCSVAGRENNPHCKEALPIDNMFFSLVIVLAITYFCFKVIKRVNG